MTAASMPGAAAAPEFAGLGEELGKLFQRRPADVFWAWSHHRRRHGEIDPLDRILFYLREGILDEAVSKSGLAEIGPRHGEQHLEGPAYRRLELLLHPRVLSIASDLHPHLPDPGGDQSIHASASVSAPSSEPDTGTEEGACPTDLGPPATRSGPKATPT